MARKFGNPGAQRDPLSYTDVRLATIPTVDFPRDPTNLDKNYPIQTIGRNSVTMDEWILVGFNANGALWVKFTGGTGDVITISDTIGTKVDPDNAGDIQLEAGAGITIVSDPPNEKLVITALAGGGGIGSIETDDGAPAVVPDGGNTIFILGGTGVDVTGQGAGNTVTVDFDVTEVPTIADTFDADFGTATPVANVLTVTGDTVTSGFNAKPVFVDASVNNLNIEVQVATTLAAPPPDRDDAGLASFDENIFLTDATTGFTTIPSILNTQGYTNLGIDYSVGTGVFTITSADGTALSALNPGNIIIPSKSNPGQLINLEVIANQNFIDDNGASEIINNLFGLPSGTAYAEDLAFFIYAVLNDDEDDIKFMISRVHSLTTSPVLASIGAPDDAVADTQGSFFSFDNIDETLFDENPCLMVGSFRMQMSAADDWTTQTLDNGDGMGLFQYERNFTFPLGAFGAAAGTYIIPNGGTAPTFVNNEFLYRVIPGGMVEVNFRQNTNTATNGAGAVASIVSLPYAVTGVNSVAMGISRTKGGSLTPQTSVVQKAASINACFSRGVGGAIVDQADFSAGDRDYHGWSVYKALQT